MTAPLRCGIVDFGGDEQHMPAITAALAQLMRSEGHEYPISHAAASRAAVMTDEGGSGSTWAAMTSSS